MGEAVGPGAVMLRALLSPGVLARPEKGEPVDDGYGDPTVTTGMLSAGMEEYGARWLDLRDGDDSAARAMLRDV